MRTGRILAAALAAALLMGALSGAAHADIIFYVQSDTVIRNGPGYEAVELCTLYEGELVEYMGDTWFYHSIPWYYIYYDTDDRGAGYGYVMSQ
ncbi:MAG: hypothetical protein GX592_04515, partial [Clostridiales bacterium]|nr:hypothetical protein [Clostridiales bacterium]